MVSAEKAAAQESRLAEQVAAKAAKLLVKAEAKVIRDAEQAAQHEKKEAAKAVKAAARALLMAEQAQAKEAKKAQSALKRAVADENIIAKQAKKAENAVKQAELKELHTAAKAEKAEKAAVREEEIVKARAEKEVQREEEATRTVVVTVASDMIKAYLQSLCPDSERVDVPSWLEKPNDACVVFKDVAAAKKFKQQKLKPASLNLSSRPKASKAHVAHFTLPDFKDREERLALADAATNALAKVAGVVYTRVSNDTAIAEFSTISAQTKFLKSKFKVEGTVVELKAGHMAVEKRTKRKAGVRSDASPAKKQK